MISSKSECALALQGYELAIHKLIANGFDAEKLTFFLERPLVELNCHKEDGIYVFYHAPCGTLIKEAERDMEKNLYRILEYIDENFETVDEQDIINNIQAHKSSIRNGMHFDVVIVKMKNSKIEKYLTFEIADETHRNPAKKGFIDKVISDAIKNKGERSQTIILHCNQYSNYVLKFSQYLNDNGFDFVI